MLLIDESQVLADKSQSALEKALRALLDTRKDQLKVIFTGSSEDRLRTMFGAEDQAFYNWARVEPLPLLGEEFVRAMAESEWIVVLRDHREGHPRTSGTTRSHSRCRISSLRTG